MQTLEQHTLESVTLYYREGNSDKVYQCQIEPAGERFPAVAIDFTSFVN